MTEKKFKITVEVSAKLKAIAIILMVAHHLFGPVANIPYTSLLTIGGLPIEVLIGRFAKICVAMFMFLSGYGFYESLNFERYSWKKNLNKILKFYLQYILVFAFFIPYGWYNNILSMKPGDILGNLFAISSTYNGAWWFAGTYIQILLFYPLFIYIARDKTIRIIIVSLSVLFIAVLIQLFPNVGLFRYISFMKNTFIWQVIFFQGYIFAKHSIFRYASFINKFWISTLVILSIFIIRSILPLNFSVYKSGPVVLTDFFLAPLFIFSLTTFLNYKQAYLLKLSKHSTNIWLTHVFFQYTYLSKVVFYPKLSILVLLFELLLTFISSFFINFLLSFLNGISQTKQIKT